MELLILKSGENYIRVTSKACHLGGIEKASVYPVQKLSTVQQLVRDLRRLGIKDIAIRKLILKEVPLEEQA